jgi:ATP-dependent DNA helicase RecG
LEKLRLAENGQIKRAAIVLFGKDPGRFYPNTFVKIGKFEDDDFTIRFQEMEDDNIIRIIEKIIKTLDYKFLIRNISFKGFNRVEPLEYPETALREMFLNALIHRNYMGAPTQIRVYDSKMFVWNDGGLPTTITLPQLTESHSSHPRNPTLARACFLGGYIDSWGSGIMKIINSCLEAGLPMPELKEKEGGFIVTLFKDNLTKEQLEKLGLNDRQIKAVLFVKSNKSIANKEYQEVANTSERTASRDLEDLVARKIFVRVGEKKATIYQLT